MKEEGLQDPWKCETNDCSNISSFPENSARLINSQEEHFSLSILSALRWTAVLPDQTGFLFFCGWKKKGRKWNGLLFHSFILLLSFSCFCTLSFFLGGRRFITMVENNNKTRTQKTEDDLSPPSAPLSPFFLLHSCSLVERMRGKRWGGRRRWRKQTETSLSGNRLLDANRVKVGQTTWRPKWKMSQHLGDCYVKKETRIHQSNSSSSPRGSLFCVLLFDMNHVRTRSKGRGVGPIITH